MGDGGVPVQREQATGCRQGILGVEVSVTSDDNYVAGSLRGGGFGVG
jgi:hypothetical protein